MSFLYDFNTIIIFIIPIVIGFIIWILGDRIAIKVKIIISVSLLIATALLFNILTTIKNEFTRVPTITFGSTPVEVAESVLRNADLSYDRNNYIYSESAENLLNEGLDLSNSDLVVVDMSPTCNQLVRKGSDVMLRIDCDQRSADSISNNIDTDNNSNDIYELTTEPVSIETEPTPPSSLANSEDHPEATNPFTEKVDLGAVNTINATSFSLSIKRKGVALTTKEAFQNLDLGTYYIPNSLVLLVNIETNEIIERKEADKYGYIEFNNIPDGIYNFAVFSDGYIMETRDEPFRIHKNEETAANTMPWSVDLEMESAEHLNEFKIRLANHDGSWIRNQEFTLRAKSKTNNSSFSACTVDTNNDGYLSFRQNSGGNDSYALITFILYDDCILEIGSDDTFYISFDPRTLAKTDEYTLIYVPS